MTINIETVNITIQFSEVEKYTFPLVHPKYTDYKLDVEEFKNELRELAKKKMDKNG